jgi:putative addiction module killer protein
MKIQLKKTNVFDKWLDSLPLLVKDVIEKYINRFLDGNTSHCKTVREGISEIKINYQKGYRVFYTVSKGTIVILFAGSDKSGNQKKQNQDIQKAIEIRQLLKLKGII